MSDAKILIVVNDAEAGNAYTNALAQTGVSCEIAHSFRQMWEMATRDTYNGFLVDILTLVRCSKEEKIIAYECINLFPVLRVKWEPRQKRIKLSPLEQSFSPDTDSALRFFIENRCKSFPPRSLRKHIRHPVNLNLLYCTGDAFSEEEAHKSFTINIGPEGIFLHTMQELQNGERIWLRFLEFADQAPISATVRWSRQWGATRCIPGVGVKFDALTESQKQQIEKILKP